MTNVPEISKEENEDINYIMNLPIIFVIKNYIV